METLNQRLTALRLEKEARRDPAVTAVLNRSTEAMRTSPALSRVKTVGDRAPLFARPNVAGDTVRLRSLLEKGPVVLSFFRGRW